jgi:hypothetical protein
MTSPQGWELITNQFTPIGQDNSLQVANNPSWDPIAFWDFFIYLLRIEPLRGVNQIQKKLTFQVQWEVIQALTH